MSPLLVALLALTSGLSNAPYARSRATPSDPNSHCLWWHGGTNVVYNQSQAGNQGTAGTEFAAVTRSWQSWQAIQASCGNLTLSEGPKVADRTIGYDQNNPNSNHNVTIFRQRFCSAAAPSGDPCFAANNCNNVYDCWQNDHGTIALTTTTFKVNTGQILDTDIEFNGAAFQFTTGDTGIVTDIQNTATHEFGHTMGLDHTSFCGLPDGGTQICSIPGPNCVCSVMRPTSSSGETSKRTVDPWSTGFICDAYPQGAPSKDCVIAAAGNDLGNVSSGGCAAVPEGPLFVLAGIVLLSLLRRRSCRC